ncbi:hypothetical protein J3F83DRAFT_341169 [Trichoderma novae-zelandiae]
MSPGGASAASRGGWTEGVEGLRQTRTQCYAGGSANKGEPLDCLTSPRMYVQEQTQRRRTVQIQNRHSTGRTPQTAVCLCWAPSTRARREGEGGQSASQCVCRWCVGQRSAGDRGEVKEEKRLANRARPDKTRDEPRPKSWSQRAAKQLQSNGSSVTLARMSHGERPTLSQSGARVHVRRPSYGLDILRRTKSLVPRSRLCNRANRRRLDSRAMEHRASGAKVGTGIYEYERAAADLESTGVIGAEMAVVNVAVQITSRIRYHRLHGAAAKATVPGTRRCTCARSFAQQPRRSGTRTGTKCLRRLPGSFIRVPWTAASSAVLSPSSSSSSLSSSSSSRIQMPGDHLWPQLLPWIVR